MICSIKTQPTCDLVHFQNKDHLLQIENETEGLSMLHMSCFGVRVRSILVFLHPGYELESSGVGRFVKGPCRCLGLTPVTSDLVGLRGGSVRKPSCKNHQVILSCGHM